MRLIVVLALMGLSASFSRTMHAESEELIPSPSGATPYKIVLSADSNVSTRPAGIYRRDGPNWSLVMAGHSLLDSRRGPIIHQLKITELDDRFPALIVLDGRLFLVSVLSDPKKPETLIQIGSPEHPLRDVVTRRPRSLPRIEDYQNYAVYALPSFYQTKNSETFQGIFVSVPGMTIFFSVKASRGKERMELFGEPVILDEAFRPPEALQKLIVFAKDPKTSLRLRSPLLTEFALQTDLTHFGEHRFFAAKGLDQIKKSDLQNEIYFDVIQQKAKIQMESVRTQEVGNFRLNQIYDLRTGVARLEISALEKPDRTTDFKNLGLFDLKDDEFFNVVDPDDPNFVVIRIEGKTYLLYKALGAKGPILFDVSNWLNNKTEIAIKASFDFTTTLPNGMTAAERIVLLSSRNNPEDSGETYALRFRQMGSSPPFAMPVIRVSKTFSSARSLALRLRASKQQLLFDNLTPLQPSTEAYEQAFNPHQPYLNLLSLQENNPEYVYLEPKMEVSLDSGRLSYKEYQKFPAVTGILKDPTGLTLSRPPNDSQFIHGQLLIADEAKQSFDLTSSTDNLKIGNHDDSVTARVFAVDPSRNNGTGTIRIVVYVHSRSNAFVPSLLELTVLAPLSRVSNVTFVLGKRDNKRQFALFYNILESPDVTSNPKISGTFYCIFQIPEGYGKVSIEKMTSQLSVEPMTTSELQQRLAYDESGQLYLVKTPDLSPHDRMFQLSSLLTGKIYQPKMNASPRDPKFNLDDLFGKEEDVHVGRQRSTSWMTDNFRLEKRFQPRQRNVEDALQLGLFSALSEELEALSDRNRSPEHKILIVPAELKKLYVAMVAALYLRSQNTSGRRRLFSNENRELTLFAIDKDRSQQDLVLDNFDGIKTNSNGRSLIFGTLADINAIDRPSAFEADKTIRLKKPSSSIGSQDETSLELNDTEFIPSILYLLSAGDVIPLQQLRETPPPKSYSVFLIGTQEEWDEVIKKAATEMSYALDGRFTIEYGGQPSTEQRVGIMNRVLQQGAIFDLNLRYDAQDFARGMNLSETEQRLKLIEYAITRCDHVAKDQGTSSYAAFLAFQKHFAQSLVSDPDVLKTRIVNKKFVERIISTAFGTPLSFENLPESDNRRKIADSNFVLKILNAGFQGRLAPIRRILKQMLATTKPRTSLNIPASFLLFGEAGRGKTESVFAIFRALGLKPYDFAHPDSNRNAQSFYFNVSTLVRDLRSDRPDAMTIEGLRNHLGKFLMSENGPNGYIFFDDIHQAPKEVRKDLVLLIRSLFDAPNGKYSASHVLSKGEKLETAEVPVFNLTVFLAMNLIYDPAIYQKILSQNKNNQNKNKLSPEMAMILATLSTEGDLVDSSFLDRIALKIPYYDAPVDAKTPQLMSQLLRTARSTLTDQGRLVLASPRVAQILAQRFVDADLRLFGSAGTSSIYDLLMRQDSGERVLLVTPLRFENPIETTASTAGTTRQDIENFVETRFKVVGLNQNFDSLLTLITMVADSFRNPVYESFVTAIQENLELSFGNPMPLSNAIFHAILDHLSERSSIPPRELNLDPTAFGFRRHSDQARIREQIDRFSQLSPSVLPFFPASLGEFGPYSEMNDENGLTLRSRRNLMSRLTKELIPVLKKQLLADLHVSDLDRPPAPEVWLRSLPESVDRKKNRDVARHLTSYLTEFLRAVFSPDLKEMKSDQFGELTTYGVTRLFLLVLDRAMFELPWTQVTQFLKLQLETLTTDQVLIQYPGVQSYFLGDAPSLLIPSTTDRAVQTTLNALALQDGESKGHDRGQKYFNETCQFYLAPIGSEGARHE